MSPRGVLADQSYLAKTARIDMPVFRLQFLYPCVFVIIFLFRSIDGVEIAEHPQGDVEPFPLESPSGFGEPVGSPEQQNSTTERPTESTLPNNRWYRRMMGNIGRKLRDCKSYFFTRDNIQQRSRVEQAAVDAVQPTYDIVNAGLKSSLVADLIQQGRSLSVPEPIAKFLTFTRENWMTILIVSTFSTGFYMIWFFVYMSYMMVSTFLSVLWAFKGTIALTASTVPVVTYAIGQINGQRSVSVAPSPDDDFKKDSGQDVSQNAAQTMGVANSKDENFYQGDDGDEDSSTFWIWMVLLIIVGLIAVISTGYFVFKKMNRRRCDDVMEV